MFRERLMDIVRMTMKESYYTEKLEQLVDEVNAEINMELKEASVYGDVR